jgi:hypothetical protein
MRVKTKGKPAKAPRSKKVVEVPIDSIKPSPENAHLYRDRAAGDTDFARLVESIKQEGIHAPLLVSKDGFIVSGHQRHKGAKAAGLKVVPVIYLNLRRDKFTSDEWLAILREHNCGREKSFDELVRERLVDIDPDEAVQQIVDDRVERSRPRIATIDIGDKEMRRFGISEEKRAMANAIKEVLDSLDEYLPVSLRAVHYRLLTIPFWRNSKDKTKYVNDKDCYKDLSNLATRMRLSGEIPWDALSDSTRPVTTWRCWRNAADFMTEQADRFLCGYARDLLQSQQQHFEVVVEKLTVSNFVKPIAGNYCMPIVVMRGNSGIDARYQIVQRFKASGKRSLFLFCFGDCDPDGDNIVASTLCSLRDDFRLANVDGTRVAMAHAQAEKLNLPNMLDAKTTSANYKTFFAKHGRNDCYELDAVQPEKLQEWLDVAIRGVIDVQAYNHEVDQQRMEAAGILARRKAVFEMMKQ